MPSCDRIAQRIARWLTSTVRRYPSASGGPAAAVQVCSDQKRAAGTVVALAELAENLDGDAALAEQLSDSIMDHVEAVSSRGATFYLYALSESGAVLVGAFPVLVKPSDVGSELVPAGAPAAPAPATLQEATAVSRTAHAMLLGERAYAGALAAQNLDTLRASADALSKVGELQGAATEVLALQAKALLEQLAAANERASAAEHRAREAEKALEESNQAHRETLALLGEAIDRGESLEREADDKKNGPFAKMKQDLFAAIMKGATGLDVRASVNGHKVDTDPPAEARGEA